MSGRLGWLTEDRLRAKRVQEKKIHSLTNKGAISRTIYFLISEYGNAASKQINKRKETREGTRLPSPRTHGKMRTA